MKRTVHQVYHESCGTPLIVTKRAGSEQLLFACEQCFLVWGSDLNLKMADVWKAVEENDCDSRTVSNDLAILNADLIE